MHFSLGLVELPIVAKIDPERNALAEQSKRFWTEFINSDYLKLEDPEQPKPKAAVGYIPLPLPAPTSWLTVYRVRRPGEVGIFLSCWRDTAGAYAMQSVVDEWKTASALTDELGKTVKPYKVAGSSMDGTIDSLPVKSLEQPEERKKAFCWLAERVKTFVRVLRPRMRSLAAECQSRAE